MPQGFKSTCNSTIHALDDPELFMTHMHTVTQTQTHTHTHTHSQTHTHTYRPCCGSSTGLGGGRRHQLVGPEPAFPPPYLSLLSLSLFLSLLSLPLSFSFSSLSLSFSRSL